MLSVALVPESSGSRLRERASILQSSLANSSLAVLLSPLLLALISQNLLGSNYWELLSHGAVCQGLTWMYR